MNKNYYRYPGSRPFQDNPIDRLLYFGRDKEKQLLFHRILSEQLIVLFARSGIGKTSLLQAGVMELLRKEGYFPITTRFNIESTPPLQSIFESIDALSNQNCLFEFIYDKESSTLKDFLNSLEIWSQNEKLMSPILVFDQFEDFFIFHENEQKDSFILDLASTLSSTILSDNNLNHQQMPPDVKIVISIREDYLAELDKLSSLIPDIFQKRMRLLPLSKENAKEAICKPSSVEDSRMQSQPFTYSERAITEMLNFLSKQKIRGQIKETNEIESFQLQLLCSFLEDKIFNNQTKKPQKVSSSDLGGDEGMNNIMSHYYEKVLDSFNKKDREKVRKLCEEYLINQEERRLSKEVNEIERDCGVSKMILEELVISRLLRSEPRVGSDYFELSHDTLVAAIKTYQKEQKGVPRKIEELLDEARKLSDDYNTDLSITKYKEVLDLDDQLVDEANDQIQTITSMKQNVSVAYKQLSICYVNQGKYEQALDTYQQAIDKNIQNAYIYLDLRMPFKEHQENRHLIALYETAAKVIELNDACYFNKLGMIWDDLKDLSKSHNKKNILIKKIYLFQQAIKINPNYDQAYNNLNLALSDLKHLEEVGDKNKNPYKGLQPYLLKDKDLFFGRANQTPGMINILKKHRFMVVFGSSGCGKSSLVKAGLFPAAQQGRINQIKNWIFVSMRPGISPLDSFKESIKKQIQQEHSILNYLDIIEKLNDINTYEYQNLKDYYSKKFKNLSKNWNNDPYIFLLIDQFEEIFQEEESARQELEKKRIEKEIFIDLILNAITLKQIYVVLTIRTGFLGKCDSFAQLSKKITNSLFFTPFLTKYQLKEVVTGPLKNEKIDDKVVIKILEDIERKRRGFIIRDQLPLLQHSLKKTWDNAYKRATENKSETIEICENDYINNDLSSSLNNNANEILKTFNIKEKEVAKVLFCALIDIKNKTRRLVTVDEIFDILNKENEELNANNRENNYKYVKKVIDSFKNNNFILQQKIDKKTTTKETLEISHECIIRQCKQLKKWVDEEEDVVNRYQKIHERAITHNEAKGKLISGEDYKQNIDWLNKNIRNTKWGERYNIDIKMINKFISDSERKSHEEDEQKQKNKRKILTIISLGILFVIFFFLTAYTYNQKKKIENVKRMFELTAHAIVKQKEDASLSFRLAEEAINMHESNFLARQTLGKTLEYPLHDLISHNDSIGSILYSHNGKYIIATSGNNIVCFYYSQENKCYSQEKKLLLKGHKDKVLKVILSPSGKLLLSVSKDSTGILWDIESGKLLRIFRGHKERINDAEFSPDGTLFVTGSNDKTIKIWKFDTDQPIWTSSIQESSVVKVAFSYNGKRIGILTNNNFLKFWNFSSRVPTPIHYKFKANNVTFSKNDNRFLVVNKKTVDIKQFSKHKIKTLYTLKKHSELIYQAVFSPDSNMVVTTSFDQTAIIWNAKTGIPSYILKRNNNKKPVKNAIFSNNGKRLIAIYDDQIASVWNVQNGELLYELRGHTDILLCAAYSPNNKNIATGSKDHTIRIWSLPEYGKQLYCFAEHKGEINTISFSNNNKYLVSASKDRTAQVWDLQKGKLKEMLRSHKNSVLSAKFDRDSNKIITASRDATAIIWDANTGKQLNTLDSHSKSIISADFSPNGKYVATGSVDKTAKLWKVNTGKCIYTFEKHNDIIWSVVFSHNGNYLITTDQSKAILWDIKEKEFINEFNNDKYFKHGVKFSNNDDYFVTVSKKMIKKSIYYSIILRTPPNGKLYREFIWHKTPVTSVMFDKGDTKIVSVTSVMLDKGDTKIVSVSKSRNDFFAGVWETKTWWTSKVMNPSMKLEGHFDIINYAEFSPDGKYIVTASDDKTCRIWDVELGQELYTLGGDCSFKTARYSIDGNIIASVSSDNSIRIWPANSKMIIKAINVDKIRGNVRFMTEKEKELYKLKD